MTRPILFISRNYPPKTGGLETYSYHLIRAFETHGTADRIVLARSSAHLIWFLPRAFLRAFLLARRHAIASIHLCDGVLAPLGLMLKRLTGVRVTVSIVGLDITFNNRLYQSVVPWCVKRLDTIISISRATRDECVRRGIPAANCTVIPVGIVPAEHSLPTPKPELRTRLELTTGRSLQGKTVLVTVGRLVRRKGVAWFVESVVTRLDPSYCYLIAGSGPDDAHIRELVRRHSLGDRVFLLGRISDEEKKVVYNACDIFIMPNITIADDVEGFGIVTIEAGSCGVPVVASDLQGIRDAVIDGKTGYLVPEGDAAGFLDRIVNMDLDGEEIRSVVNAAYDWRVIGERYRDVLLAERDRRVANPQ